MKNIFGAILLGAGLFGHAAQDNTESSRLIDDSSVSFDDLSAVQQVCEIDLENGIYCFNPVMKKLVVAQPYGGGYQLSICGMRGKKNIWQLGTVPLALQLVLDTRLRKLCFKHEPKVLTCSSEGVDEYTVQRLCFCETGWYHRQIILWGEDKMSEDDKIHFSASYDGNRIIRGKNNVLKIYSSTGKILLEKQFDDNIQKIEHLADESGDTQTCNSLSIVTDNNRYVTNWDSRSSSYRNPRQDL